MRGEAWCTTSREGGFTFVEALLAVLTLVIAIVAILGAYLGQVILSEHARNLSWAVQDANRIIEQIRQESTGTPCHLDIIPPSGGSWNGWLAGAGGGKSIQPNPVTEEMMVVTCQHRAGTQYCPATQMGTEWHADGPAGDQDPLRVTVSVCWRHRNRTIGECTWNGATLSAADGQNGPNTVVGVVESPAMLTTLVTCRG